MLLELAFAASVLLQNQSAQPALPFQPNSARHETVHDKTFWQNVVKSDFRLPAGSSTSQLASELSQALGSQDPELRDDIAYNVLSTWIYKTHDVDGDTLRGLTTEWLDNLKTVSDPAPESVLRRSFSALMLSVVVARDNADPFLDKQEFRKIWDGALTYLEAEKDLRGFDARVGWIHSAAHTADLLKFLARSRYVERDDQAALLAAIRRKLSTVPTVFTYGEDERYARAVLSLIARKDFDQEAFAKWAKETRPARPGNGLPDEQLLRSNQNLKNFLAKLDFIVSLQPEPGAAMKSAEEAVRGAIKGTF